MLGLQLAPTYAGVLTQAAARTLTVGAGGLDQAGATFVGGTAAITVNGGYVLAAGTFTTTSGTLTVTGDFTHSGGTFLHGNGTLRLSGALAATIDVSANELLNNLTVAAGNLVSKTIAAGDTLTVAGTASYGSMAPTWLPTPSSWPSRQPAACSAPPGTWSAASRRRSPPAGRSPSRSRSATWEPTRR